MSARDLGGQTQAHRNDHVTDDNTPPKLPFHSCFFFILAESDNEVVAVVCPKEARMVDCNIQPGAAGMIV
jgi:hypothetical protein